MRQPVGSQGVDGEPELGEATRLDVRFYGATVLWEDRAGRRLEVGEQRLQVFDQPFFFNKGRDLVLCTVPYT
jgi:hypothetical protein